MEWSCGPAVMRPWRLSDAPSLAAAANSHAIWRNLRDAFPHPYTLADAERYLAATVSRVPPVAFALAVEGAAVGGLSLRVGTDIARRSAELGYWLAEAHWGRGIVTAAIRAATVYAFGELELVRVWAVPFVRNPASARVLERAGYVREGVLRASAVKEGDLLDQYLYAIVRPDVRTDR